MAVLIVVCSVPRITNPHFRPTEKLRFIKLQRSFAVPVTTLNGSHVRHRNCIRSSVEDAADSSSESGIQAEKPADNAQSPVGNKVAQFRGASARSESEKSTGARSALERAAAYKRLKDSGASQKPKLEQGFSVPVPPKVAPEVEIIRGQSIQSELQSSETRRIDPSLSDSSISSVSSTSNVSYAGVIPPSSLSDGSSLVKRGMELLSSDDSSLEKQSESLDANPVKLENLLLQQLAVVSESGGIADQSGEEKGQSKAVEFGKTKKEPVNVSAFERAKAYKEQQAEMIAALQETPEEPSRPSEESTSAPSKDGEKVIEIEILTREGVIKKKVSSPEQAFSNLKSYKTKGVSGIDFAGLGFADKKKTGRSSGFSSGYQPPPPGALPEVEIITKDSQSEVDGESKDSELYKPRVSTWGVFPRPADISKTYGGGRTIRPGESLETEEERIARETKTQRLLADYRRKMGLDIDPRIKAECEKTMKQGDDFMDSGRLREALTLYEKVMEKMTFQSELHGLAALRGAICLDSLNRLGEARQVYEKLISHPNGRIRKQAKQLLFGFQAMENLKVSSSNKWDTSVYRKYFDPFADGYNNTYRSAEEETKDDFLQETLPYALLLLFPVLLVAVLAAYKGA